MADNTTIDLGSGGNVIASDDISSVHYQRVKVSYGADGSATDSSPATPFPTAETHVPISRGTVTGYKVVHVFGRNDDCDAAEDVWESGGDFNWETSAAVVSTTSTDTDDDGAPTTGTGAQTVTIEGLDASFDEQSETITMNGTSAVVTSATFIRVNSAYVVTVGTYHGTNEGTIIGTINGNASYSFFVGEGQSQECKYTVPNGKKAYIEAVYISVDSAKTADVSIYTYEGADDITQPFAGAKKRILRFDAVSGEESFVFEAAPIEIPGKTDIWARVDAVSTTNLPCEVDIELIVVDD